jgi:hypothetical protein
MRWCLRPKKRMLSVVQEAQVDVVEREGAAVAMSEINKFEASTALDVSTSELPGVLLSAYIFVPFFLFTSPVMFPASKKEEGISTKIRSSPFSLCCRRFYSKSGASSATTCLRNSRTFSFDARVITATSFAAPTAT